MEIPRHKIIFAIVSFIVGMLLLYFAGSYLQYHFGILGLALTEFMILAIALLSVFASRMSFKQVFRIRHSSARFWLSSFLIYLSAFFGAAAVSYILSWLFPSVQETSSQINSLILSGSFVLAFISVSILPGICEEAWHRGYLLTCFGSIKSIAARVAIMGFLFGIFHMDPTRFLQTLILGLALSFMRIKTDNFLIPVAFHCLNNLFSISMVFFLELLTKSMGGVVDLAASENVQEALSVSALVPLVCFTTALSALFLTLGLYNFKRAESLQPMLQPSVPQPSVPQPYVPQAFAPQPFAPQAWAPPAWPPTMQASPLQAPPPALPPTIQPQQLQAPQNPHKKRVVLIVSICGAIALLSCIACFALSFLQVL